ncbi:MAG TPA: LysM peptidoglycan-binding domain-containing protein [Solirubrobacterales bacterium]|nr:LysM peptidoglycan-binding domain-containing protein [Solirubrobacterales bacterium]
MKKKRTKAPARLLAVVALIGAAIAVGAVISGATDGDSAPKSQHGKEEKKKPRTKAAFYVVESGDTLISIARQTGIPVAEIIALNPEVDPQILETGEKLKLK